MKTTGDSSLRLFYGVEATTKCVEDFVSIDAFPAFQFIDPNNQLLAKSVALFQQRQGLIENLVFTGI